MELDPLLILQKYQETFFRDPKKMFMHYGKHLYDEGKVFKHIPPVDGSGEGFDEFGRIYRCFIIWYSSIWCWLIGGHPGTSVASSGAGKP